MDDRQEILVVDDTPENLRVLGSILEKEGHEVRVAADGSQALRSAKASPPDLILLDILMPGMDGFEVCRRLKAEPELAKIPVIFISALGMVEQKVTGFREGAVDYITKPFQAEEVVARVHTHLQLTRIEELKREIEERKAAEAKLKAAKEYTENLVRTANAMIIGLDAHGNVTVFNRAAETVTGYAAEELTGRNGFEVLIPRERYPRLSTECSPLSEAELPEASENTILTKAGEERLISWRSSIIKENDVVSGSIFFGIDVTEQRKCEERLAMAQKLEAIGTLAGGIAHDFNNVLGAILGYTEMALMEVPQDKTALREDLGQVLQAGNRAASLVKQILSFSREVSQERKPLDLKPIVKETLKLLRATIPTTIEIQQSLATEGHIEGDGTEVHQILMNLCTNASLAMEEEGGVLKVDLRETYVDGQTAAADPDLAPGRYVALAVSDTGHGIAPENLPKIFEPFFTTRTEGRGTGLGLSVVYGIVKGYRGTVTAESTVGEGTTFRILIPICRDEVEDGETCAHPFRQGREHILFVEDEHSLVQLVKTALTRFGYRVTAFTNSEEALSAFAAAPEAFDVVISDLTMPHLTGDRLACEIKKIRPDIPFMLASGNAACVAQEQFGQLGIDVFLQKPILLENLTNEIRKIFDRS